MAVITNQFSQKRDPQVSIVHVIDDTLILFY